jgi:hypothetical protein
MIARNNIEHHNFKAVPFEQSAPERNIATNDGYEANFASIPACFWPQARIADLIRQSRA